MSKFNIAFKKTIEEAKKPQYAHETDACLDMFAATDGKLVVDRNGLRIMYDTGIAIQVPRDHVGLVFPRSSIGTKMALSLSNSVGVIDSGYHGSIKFYFNILNEYGVMYKKGDAIGQIMIVPRPSLELVEVQEFSENSSRGTGGFGSTGDGQDR